MMNRLLIALILIICPLVLYAQDPGGNYNPYVSGADINPKPLWPVESGGTGLLSFNIGNTGSDPLAVFSGHQITMTITLSYGEPDNIDPLSAIGGTSKNLFTWSYNAGTKTYTALQTTTIPANSVGSITISYKVSQNSTSGTPSNGVNINLVPAPYQTTSNSTPDDNTSIYTWTEIRDYGDAPSIYGSADHILDFTNYLGTIVDGESASQPSANADADDNNNLDDEDGVTFPALIKGLPATITVQIKGLGFLNAWIDWNIDGDFSDAGERIASNMVGYDSPLDITFTVPAEAVSTSPTFARFRSATSPFSSSSGSVTGGETEDYMIQVDCPLPERPGQITGVTTQCPDVSDQIYEVAEVNNATSYTWIVPTGWQIDSGQGTRRINVTTGSAGEGGEISVTASNTCGTSAARTIIVAVAANVGTPSTPNTSSSTICQGTASSVFTTLASNATDYVWSVTGTGNTIIGTGTTGTVTWAPAFSGIATISVYANGCNGPSSTVSTTVTIRPTPVVSISGTTAVCLNAPSPDVTFINPQSLPVTVTYNINGLNQTTIDVSANSTATVAAPSTNVGTFVYNLISAAYQTMPTCSNTLTGSATITVNALPIVNAGTDKSIANGTSTTLSGSVTGTGPFTYSWTPVSLLVNAAVEDPTTVNLSTTTTFNFTATINATGCFNSDNVTISVTGGALSASASATPSILCIGNSTQLNANASGGSESYNYSWTSNPAGFISDAANPTVSPTANTIYHVTVNDGFNTVYSNVSVTVNPLPSQPGAFTSSTTTVCQGASNVIYTVPNDPTVTYNWSYSGTGATITGTTNSITVNYSSSATSGTLIVTASNSCGTSSARTAAITVNTTSTAPSGVSITNNNTCNGTSKTLTVTGGSLGTGAVWQWFTNSCGGTPAGTGPSITVNPAAGTSTTYYVRASGTCNTTSCASGTVIVPGNVGTPSTPNTSSSTICQGTASSVFTTLASNATDYVWSVTGTGNTITGTGTTGTVTWAPAFSGIATISVYANGCNGPSSTVSTTVTIRPTPAVSISGTTAVCLNAPSPDVTFINPQSLPVRITYNINGLNQTTIDVSANSTATVAAPSTNVGTFVYNLVSAAYQTMPMCSNALTGSATITVNALPTVNAGTDKSIANGTSTTLNGIVTGTGPFTYSWTPASLLVNAAVEDPVTVNLTSTTTFTLTATINATGCYASDAVTISVTGGALNASPTATPGTICAGESVQLNAMASGGSGTYSYLWSSIPAGFTSTLANPVATPSISTTYQVAVNDGFSTVNRQVSVIVNPTPARPSITPSGPTTFCSGGSVTLISSAGNSYLWSTGATTQSIIVNSSGSYTVTVISSTGCESPVSLPVSVTVNPLPAAPSITASGTTTFCAGGNVTLTSSAGTTYLWSNGATTQSINVTTSGSYTVRITNANGCQSPLSTATVVTVNPLPGVNAGTDASIPNGTSTTLNGTVTGTGPFTYSWTPAALLVNAAVEDPATVNLTSITTFTFTARINATGCSNSDNVIISVLGGALNASPTATPGTICAGETVQLDAAASGGSGTYTYLWSSVPAGFSSTFAKPTATPSVNTTYYVAVNDGFSTVNRQIAVTVNALPARPTITPSGPLTFCAGGSVTLTSSLATTYAWSTGATTRSINVTTSGNYTVKVTNTSGCESQVSEPVTVTVNAIPPAPTIAASGPTTICAGGSVTLTSSPGTVYLWSTGATTQNINVTSAGSYTVRITSASGCQSPPSTATVVTVNPNPGVNAGTDASIPNGTSTTLNATVTGTGPFTYSWTPASLLVNATVVDPVTVNLTSTTTFTLTATITATGCSASDAVTVSVTGGALNANPTATPGSVCAGSDVQLDAAASGGSGTYTYSWSSVPAGFTSTIARPVVTPEVNTTYTVIVNDGFTSVGRQVPVTVNAIPPDPSITASGPVTFCIGGNVTLTSSSATNYLWSTGATSRSITVTTSGIYSVRVRNAAGCLSEPSPSTTVTVRPLPAAPLVDSIGHPTCTSATGSVRLAGLPETGIWTLTRYAGGITTTGAGSVSTVSGLPTGTYNFTVRDESGCTSLVSSNVIINSQPLTPSAPVVGNITHPTYTVPTGSVVLTGLPTPGAWRLTRYPGGVIINGSGSSRTVSGLEPGTYTFTVSNAFGCISASSASVLINARPGPPTVIITDPDTICSISTADLTRPEITAGSDPNLTFTYWMDKDTVNPVPNPAAVPPGVYYIKGSTTANYYTIKPVTVTADQMPVADAGPDQVLGFTFTTNMDAYPPEAGTGIWSVDAGTGTFTDIIYAKSKVSDLSVGRNEFTWTVTNGACPPVSDKVVIQVNDLMVPSLITPNLDGNNDFLVIQGIESLGKTELIVFDRRGVEVFKDQNYNNDWDGVDIDKNPLPDDTYFYMITTGIGRTMRGFVVIRR